MEKVHGVFGNDFARNVVIFGVDNSSSSHTDNQKNNFLVLDEGLTDGTGLSDSTGAAEKKLTLLKQRQNLAWV